MTMVIVVSGAVLMMTRDAIAGVMVMMVVV